MKHQNISNGGNAPRIADYWVVALYNSDSGAIRHLHTVTVFEGGDRVTESEAIERAQELASKAGHDIGQLKHKVAKSFEHGSRPHRIDPKTGEFVTVEIKRRNDLQQGRVRS